MFIAEQEKRQMQKSLAIKIRFNYKILDLPMRLCYTEIKYDMAQCPKYQIFISGGGVRCLSKS